MTEHHAHNSNAEEHTNSPVGKLYVCESKEQVKGRIDLSIDDRKMGF